MKNVEFKCNNLEINDGDKTLLCGIINVTPDSFSDGGKYLFVDDALNRALKLIEDGADMLDIGGESTRPGSTPVSTENEINRIVPVISAIKNHSSLKHIPLSVDTWKSEVAKAAIEAGADIINDITGLLGDENMAKVIGESKAGLIAMFNSVVLRPHFKTAKNFPTFGSGVDFKISESEMSTLTIVDLMKLYFDKTFELAHRYDIPDNRIMLDLGIGFGLTKKENLKLVNEISVLREMGYCSFLGVSRKRFISNILDEGGYNVDMKTSVGLSNMDYASAFLTSIAAFSGVNILRVHDIPKHRQAVLIADSVRMADKIEDMTFSAYK